MQRYFKLIVMAVLVELIARAVLGFLTFVSVDEFLEREYKDNYREWKSKNFYYTSASG